METQDARPPVNPPQYQPQYQPPARPQKTVAMSLLLTFLFGPFGLFYASVVGGFVMLGLWVLSIILAVITSFFLFGATLFVTVPLLWIGQMVWAAVAVQNAR